jgi:hypothetical protein
VEKAEAGWKVEAAVGVARVLKRPAADDAVVAG